MFSLDLPDFNSGNVYVQSETGNESGLLWSFNAEHGRRRLGRFPSAPNGMVTMLRQLPTGAIWVDGGHYGGMYGYNQATGAQLFFKHAAI